MKKCVALLETLREDGRSPALWLRDDDLCTDSPNLRLMFKFAEWGIPLAFAVVPYRCKFSDADLALIKAQPKNIFFCVHGHSHANRSKNGKPCEYPEDFSTQRSEKELRYGFEKIRSYFPDRFIPMFVPPWNFLHENHVPALESSGFQYISGHKGMPVGGEGGSFQTISVDFDILNYGNDLWYPLKPEDQFDQELYEAIERWVDEGRAEDPIGILSHHSTMRASDIGKYRKLLSKIVGLMRAFEISEVKKAVAESCRDEKTT